jgi:YVTN family beta-propeller protein
MIRPKTIVSEFQKKRAGVNLRGVKLASVLMLALAGLSCGDQFRPVAVPIPLPSPNPAASHFVASLSLNGSLDPGAVSRIDVSGDSVSSVFATGVAPVHAAFLHNGTKIYVANSGEDTVSASNSSNTTQAVTISLPQLCDASGCASSVPVFVNSTENGKMYVANSGNGTVSVINTTSDVVVNTVAVDPAFAGSPGPAPNRGANPVALAELPNGSKVYSVNQGSGTVSSISTVDDTVLSMIPIGAPPIWAVASSDSAFVYVLDTNGTISVIDTLSDTVVPSASASAGAGANYMFFDNVLNRLYVTNPAAATVSIFEVAGKVLTANAGSPVAITPAAGSACGSAPQPTSVNVIGDGSRAYVSSFQADPNTVCTQATVINSGTGAVSSMIPLSQSTNASAQTGCGSARFRTFATSSTGGPNSNIKVYVSQCDAGAVAVIDTFASNTGANQHPADVMEGNVPAPLSSFAPPSGETTPPSQNPVFVTAAP